MGIWFASTLRSRLCRLENSNPLPSSLVAFQGIGCVAPILERQLANIIFTKMQVEVRSKLERHNRAGFSFTREYRMVEVTEEQLEAIKNDEFLSVREKAEVVIHAVEPVKRQRKAKVS